LANIPLFIWDPRSRIRAERRNALVQMIDLPATLLEFFSVERPPDMLGQPLRETIATDASVRDAALFGLHGAHVNCTDGRYVYMRAPANSDNTPLFEYTLMPTRIRSRFAVEDLQGVTLCEPFSFTKGCRLMKVPGRRLHKVHPFTTMLFDLENDPAQKHPIHVPEIEQQMIAHMVQVMQAHDSPPEQFERLGLHQTQT